MVFYLFCFALGALFKFYDLREKSCNLLAVFGTNTFLEISYREKDGRLKGSFIIGIPILEGGMGQGQSIHEALCTPCGQLGQGVLLQAPAISAVYNLDGASWCCSF